MTTNEPLPLSVELARELYLACGRDIEFAARIDARLRPLVEALDCLYEAVYNVWPQYKSDAAIQDSEEAALAALKASGLPKYAHIKLVDLPS